jgi:hypothetical protein
MVGRGDRGDGIGENDNSESMQLMFFKIQSYLPPIY